MIDDIAVVSELIEKIKAVLPISAYPTKKLCYSLKNKKGIKLKPKKLLRINDVFNMGDEGGIGCAISIKNDTNLFVSLTHLQIKEPHSLAKEIKLYRINRIRKLVNKYNDGSL